MAYNRVFARYYDRLYSKKNYEAEVAYILKAYERFRGRLPRKILDVGCGTGNHAMILGKRGLNVVGIDISSEMINAAKRKITDELRDNIRFVCFDLKDFMENGFDLVIRQVVHTQGSLSVRPYGHCKTTVTDVPQHKTQENTKLTAPPFV